MIYRMDAVLRILEAILFTDGPVLSARRICRVLAPFPGANARINTSTPMPPAQLEKLRQNSIHLLMLSISSPLSMVEPVVVNPETISKKQFIKPFISPLK